MKNLLLAAMFAGGVCAAVEAAPTDTVTQADLQALIQRISKLEAENKAQAAKIAELEGAAKKAAPAVVAAKTEAKAAETTEVSESGKIYTTESGKKYFLADATANIFEPLSESGLKITPYGYLVFEAVHNTRGTEVDIYTDYVRPKSSQGYRSHTTVFSMQDSILGLQFDTPERVAGWTFTGRAEFDLAGDHANDYDFHWRHLYFDAQHESGWSVLFGQTWHLWKMVAPSEIDGAWMENTGYPYRRSPQIRVTKKWDLDDSSSLEARFGLVKNGPGMGSDRDHDGSQDNSSSAWPLFEAAFLYDHDAAWEDKGSGKRWLFGIGGQYGRDRSYRFVDLGDDAYAYGDAEDYNSQMIMLAGSIPFGDFTLCGQIFAGENLGRVQAGVGQGVGFSEWDKRGKEVATVGGFIDLNYKLNEKWSFAIGYGFDDPHMKRGYTEGTENITYNDRAYIDAFYQLMDNFKLGLEYGRLSTKYLDDGTAYDDRIQFSAFYDF